MQTIALVLSNLIIVLLLFTVFMLAKNWSRGNDAIKKTLKFWGGITLLIFLSSLFFNYVFIN